jgi:beta-glucosidase
VITRTEIKSIRYIGSGTSLFQAEPLVYDKTGKAEVLADWEYQILQNNTRQVNPQTPQQLRTSFPHFLSHAEDYVRRSAALGENMFRFSFEFPRICPREGQFDEKLMGEYVKVLALVKKYGQEPLVTLHHYTMPMWLTRIDSVGNIITGGWEHTDVLKHFRFYIKSVLRFLSNEDKMRDALRDAGLDVQNQDQLLAMGLVKYFMSINEPAAILSNGYLTGIFHPYKHCRLLTMKRILGKLVEAHEIARDEIKRILRSQPQEAQLGIGYNWQCWEGMLGPLMRGLEHIITRTIEKDGTYSDFIGLQYYMRLKLPMLPGERTKRDWSDHPGFGDIYPRGIFDVLKRMHAAYPRKPIFVTEFGFSDAQDLRRPFWILETMRYITEAKRSGVPVEGVLLWSLVNNFEWDQGMSQKFGLFDEPQLDQPLFPSANGIKSWEAWRATTRAVLEHSAESLNELKRVYERAKQQYLDSGGMYR